MKKKHSHLRGFSSFQGAVADIKLLVINVLEIVAGISGRGLF